MKVIVASDIHGVHDQLRQQLAALGQPIIISPWPGEGRPHATEQDAVAAFHLHDGLTSYEQKIAAAADGEPVMLIGFSVGATSAWRYVASPHCNPNSRAILYDGSRIRDHVALVPRCPATLFFAEHEASFNPEAVAESVRKPGVHCTVVSGTHHGFMNPASKNFRPDIAQEHVNMLVLSTRPPGELTIADRYNRPI